VAALSACWHSDGEAADAGSDAGPIPRAGVILDGGGTVPDPPDGASLCPQGSCNYQSQTGCASDLACRPAVADAAIAPNCEPTGAAGDGDLCDGSAECSRGFVCAEGRCHRLCCGGDWSACPAGQSCYRALSLVVVDAGGPTGASLCYPVGGCDVLDPASCSAQPNQSCQIVDPKGEVACAPRGTRGTGQPCGADNPCGPLNLCVDWERTWQCRQLCRAAEGAPEPACPADGGVCVHYARDPAGVGECTPL
jgi:hypothetical protein